VERTMDELVADGAEVLVAGLRSSGWERVRDRFVEWFERRGLDDWAGKLRLVDGPVEGHTAGFMVVAVWRIRLSEGLADAWDLDGSDELAAIIEGFVKREPEMSSRGEVPASAATREVPGDRFDFQGITVNGQFVGVQHAYGVAAGAAAQPGAVDWPAAKDMEPWAYGVRPTRRAKGLPQLPPYVARDADPAVNSAVASAASEGGLIVVRGDAFVGKSRTALAAMAEVLPGVRVFAPARHENLRQLPALLRGLPGEHCALWLDDLDGHLEEGGLEPRLLAQLTGQGVVVVATMREDAYDDCRQTSSGRVLDLAHIVDLPGDWSYGERKRAEEAEDPRVTEAVRRCGPEGVASYLAVGPKLWEEWQRARRADQHPRGYALVRAAVDLALCGLRGPLPQDLLVKVHEGYEAAAGLERESVDDALVWAAEKRDGVLRMLRRSGASTWEASPYLVDTASQDEAFPVVDGAVWGVALEVARADSAYDFNVVLAGARRAFRAVAEEGDGRAMFELGVLEASVGDEGEAETWFRRAAEAGQAEAAGRLGRLLAERGSGKEAEPFLEAAAEAGDAGAATLLGKVLRDRAARWLTRAADQGSAEAAHALGDLRMASDGDAVLGLYDDAAWAGRSDVAHSIGMWHLAWSDRETGKIWLRRAADAGDEVAADLLRCNEITETLEGAEEAFGVREDIAFHITNRGVALEELGEVDEAESSYQKGYAMGDSYGAYRLGVRRERQGHFDEARNWYRKAADMGHPAAKKALGEKFKTPDAVTE